MDIRLPNDPRLPEMAAAEGFDSVQDYVIHLVEMVVGPLEEGDAMFSSGESTTEEAEALFASAMEDDERAPRGRGMEALDDEELTPHAAREEALRQKMGFGDL